MVALKRVGSPQAPFQPESRGGQREVVRRGGRKPEAKQPTRDPRIKGLRQTKVSSSQDEARPPHGQVNDKGGRHQQRAKEPNPLRTVRGTAPVTSPGASLTANARPRWRHSMGGLRLASTPNLNQDTRRRNHREASMRQAAFVERLHLPVSARAAARRRAGGGCSSILLITVLPSWPTTPTVRTGSRMAKVTSMRTVPRKIIRF